MTRFNFINGLYLIVLDIWPLPKDSTFFADSWAAPQIEFRGVTVFFNEIRRYLYNLPLIPSGLQSAKLFSSGLCCTSWTRWKDHWEIPEKCD